MASNSEITPGAELSGSMKPDEFLDFVSGYIREPCKLAQQIEMNDENSKYSKYICVTDHHTNSGERFAAVHCVLVDRDRNESSELWRRVFPGTSKRLTASSKLVALTLITSVPSTHTAAQCMMVLLSTIFGRIIEIEPICVIDPGCHIKAIAEFLVLIENLSNLTIRMLKLNEDERLVEHLNTVRLPAKSAKLIDIRLMNNEPLITFEDLSSFVLCNGTWRPNYRSHASCSQVETDENDSDECTRSVFMFYRAALIPEIKKRAAAIEDGRVHLLSPDPILFWSRKLFGLLKNEKSAKNTCCEFCNRNEQMKALHLFVSSFRFKDIISAYKDNTRFVDDFIEMLISNLGEDMPIVFMELIECLGRTIPIFADLPDDVK